MSNNGPDIKVLTETEKVVDAKQKEKLQKLEAALVVPQEKNKIENKLKSATNEVLENVKSNLIKRFFDTNNKIDNSSIQQFRCAHGELLKEVSKQFPDISKDPIFETFNTIDKIIKVGEEPQDLENINEALKDDNFLDAVRKNIKETEKHNKDDAEKKNQKTFNPIYTTIEKAQLSGQSLDNYNNLKTICKDLDNDKLNFASKETIFIKEATNSKTFTLDNYQVLNQILTNYKSNKKLDILRPEVKKADGKSIDASSDQAKEEWITKITQKIQNYATIMATNSPYIQKENSNTISEAITLIQTILPLTGSGKPINDNLNTALKTLNEIKGVDKDTPEKLKKLKEETLALIERFAPNVRKELAGHPQDLAKFNTEITILTNKINSANKSIEIIQALDENFKKAQNGIDKKNQGLIKIFAGDMLDRIKSNLAAGTQEFEALKAKYGATEQISYKDVLQKLSTPEFFNEGKYRDAYDIIFDNMTTPTRNDRHDFIDGEKEMATKNILAYAKTEVKEITEENVTLGYVVANDDMPTTPDNNKNDTMTRSYTEGTRIIRIKNKEGATTPLAAPLYIFFGTKQQEYANKAKRVQDLIKEKKNQYPNIKNLDFNDIKSGERVTKEGDFKYSGHIAFKDYLLSQKGIDISNNMKYVLEKIKSYDNPNNSDNELIKDGLYTAFVEAIIEKAKNKTTEGDMDILKDYINLINTDTNNNILTPGNNGRDREKLGRTFEEQRKNFSIIKDFATANLTNGTEADKATLAKIAIVESLIYPQNQEKKIGLLQSIKSLLNGDYENMNPAIRKLFFMIAEFFGGKDGKWANKLSKEMKEKLDNFYAKEFKVSAEKKDAVNNLNEKYNKNKNDKAIIKEKYSSEFANTFDSETHDFHEQAFKEAFKTVDAKQLDPEIIKGIITRNHIQGTEKLINTENREGKPQIDQTEFDKNKISDNIANAIFNDPTALKAVKNAMKKSGLYKTAAVKEDGTPGSLNSTEKAKNGANISTGLGAYLMAGSKEHFYNVLKENKFINPIADGMETQSYLDKSGKDLAKKADLAKNFTRYQGELTVAEADLKTLQDKLDKEKDEEKKKPIKEDIAKKEKDITETKEKLKGATSQDEAIKNYNDEIKSTYENIFQGDKKAYDMLANSIYMGYNKDIITADRLKIYLRKNEKYDQTKVETLNGGASSDGKTIKIDDQLLSFQLKELKVTTPEVKAVEETKKEEVKGADIKDDPEAAKKYTSENIDATYIDGTGALTKDATPKKLNDIIKDPAITQATITLSTQNKLNPNQKKGEPLAIEKDTKGVRKFSDKTKVRIKEGDKITLIDPAKAAELKGKAEEEAKKENATIEKYIIRPYLNIATHTLTKAVNPKGITLATVITNPEITTATITLKGTKIPVAITKNDKIREYSNNKAPVKIHEGDKVIPIVTEKTIVADAPAKTPSEKPKTITYNVLASTDMPVQVTEIKEGDTPLGESYDFSGCKFDFVVNGAGMTGGGSSSLKGTFNLKGYTDAHPGREIVAILPGAQAKEGTVDEKKLGLSAGPLRICKENWKYVTGGEKLNLNAGEDEKSQSWMGIKEDGTVDYGTFKKGTTYEDQKKIADNILYKSFRCSPARYGNHTNTYRKILINTEDGKTHLLMVNKDAKDVSTKLTTYNGSTIKNFMRLDTGADGFGDGYLIKKDKTPKTLGTPGDNFNNVIVVYKETTAPVAVAEKFQDGDVERTIPPKTLNISDKKLNGKGTIEGKNKNGIPKLRSGERKDGKFSGKEVTTNKNQNIISIGTYEDNEQKTGNMYDRKNGKVSFKNDVGRSYSFDDVSFKAGEGATVSIDEKTGKETFNGPVTIMKDDGNREKGIFTNGVLQLEADKGLKKYGEKLKDLDYKEVADNIIDTGITPKDLELKKLQEATKTKIVCFKEENASFIMEMMSQVMISSGDMSIADMDELINEKRGGSFSYSIEEITNTLNDIVNGKSYYQKAKGNFEKFCKYLIDTNVIKYNTDAKKYENTSNKNFLNIILSDGELKNNELTAEALKHELNHAYYGTVILKDPKKYQAVKDFFFDDKNIEIRNQFLRAIKDYRQHTDLVYSDYINKSGLPKTIFLDKGEQSQDRKITGITTIGGKNDEQVFFDEFRAYTHDEDEKDVKSAKIPGAEADILAAEKAKADNEARVEAELDAKTKIPTVKENTPNNNEKIKNVEISDEDIKTLSDYGLTLTDRATTGENKVPNAIMIDYDSGKNTDFKIPLLNDSGGMEKDNAGNITYDSKATIDDLYTGIKKITINKIPDNEGYLTITLINLNPANNIDIKFKKTGATAKAETSTNLQSEKEIPKENKEEFTKLMKEIGFKKYEKAELIRMGNIGMAKTYIMQEKGKYFVLISGESPDLSSAEKIMLSAKYKLVGNNPYIKEKVFQDNKTDGYTYYDVFELNDDDILKQLNLKKIDTKEVIDTKIEQVKTLEINNKKDYESLTKGYNPIPGYLPINQYFKTGKKYMLTEVISQTQEAGQTQASVILTKYMTDKKITSTLAEYALTKTLPNSNNISIMLIREINQAPENTKTAKADTPETTTATPITVDNLKQIINENTITLEGPGAKDRQIDYNNQIAKLKFIPDELNNYNKYKEDPRLTNQYQDFQKGVNDYINTIITRANDMKNNSKNGKIRSSTPTQFEEGETRGNVQRSIKLIAGTAGIIPMPVFKLG